VATVGLGLYSYYVRELLVSFFLFGVAFSFVALVDSRLPWPAYQLSRAG